MNTLEVWPGHSNSSGNSNVCRGFRGQAGEGSPTQSNLPQLLVTRSGDQLHCLGVNRLGAGVDAPTPREAKSLWSESCPIFPQGLSACSSIGNLLASKTNNLDRTGASCGFRGDFTSVKGAVRHMDPILSLWQASLINHGTERLSNLAKVTRLRNERSRTLNLNSLDSSLDLNHRTILSCTRTGPEPQRWAHAAWTSPQQIRDENKRP